MYTKWYCKHHIPLDAELDTNIDTSAIATNATVMRLISMIR